MKDDLKKGLLGLLGMKLLGGIKQKGSGSQSGGFLGQMMGLPGGILGKFKGMFDKKIYK